MFRAVDLTKNTDSNKYGYGSYEILFDVRSQFVLPIVKWNENTFISAMDNSPKDMLIKRKKDTLVPREGTMDGLDKTEYCIYITKSRMEISLILYYNSANCFSNSVKIYQLKLKDF